MPNAARVGPIVIIVCMLVSAIATAGDEAPERKMISADEAGKLSHEQLVDTYVTAQKHAREWRAEAFQVLGTEIVKRPEEMDAVLIQCANTVIGEDDKAERLDQWTAKRTGTLSEAVLGLLGMRANAAGIKYLLTQIESPHPIIRAAVPRVLNRKYLADPANKKTLLWVIHLLNDPDPMVVSSTMIALTMESNGPLIVSLPLAQELLKVRDNTSGFTFVYGTIGLKAALAEDIAAYRKALAKVPDQDKAQQAERKKALELLELDARTH